MALKVYTSGNYIITDTGTVMHEFAKGYTTYSYNQSTQTFTIRESVGGSFIVTRAQLLAGDITNESSVAYTFSTFVTFLRENTGFKTASGGSEAYSTTVVNISSAQILAMGTTPIELLPAAGVGKYYDVDKIILEYTNNTTAYSLVDDFLRVTYSTLGYSIDKQVITAGVDALCIADSTYSISVGNQLFSQALLPNASIELTTDNGTDPTLGDGTLRAIITYTTRTFGL